uniref:Uncharacterized protein n=1 Tax=Cannabis sativa TaxID=3483 RepID=A0A803NIG9_CANSA
MRCEIPPMVRCSIDSLPTVFVAPGLLAFHPSNLVTRSPHFSGKLYSPSPPFLSAWRWLLGSLFPTVLRGGGFAGGSGNYPFLGQRLGWMRDLLHEERYGRR